MREAAPNSLDGAIVAFGRSWVGYGGGSDEDIYVEFGLAPGTYFERLRRLLDAPIAADIDDSTREQMRAVCTRRLTHRRQ